MKNNSNKNIVKVVLDFVVEKRRYFCAGVLLVIMVVVLACCTGPKKSTAETEVSQNVQNTENGNTLLADYQIDEDYEKDAYLEVNALMENYLNAYFSNDISAIKDCANPVSDREASYIGVWSEHVNGVNGIECYTMHGLTEGAFLVSVYYEIEFADVDTAAPALGFFYVEKNDEGNYYINNLYGAFNLENREYDLDPAISELIELFKLHDSVIKKIAEVNSLYSDRIASDENLEAAISSLLTDINTWKDAKNAEEQVGEDTESGTEAGTEVASEEESQVEESEAESEAEEEPDEDVTAPDTDNDDDTVVKVRVIKDDVNVRDAASTDGLFLGKVSTGETFVKLGEEGEWTKIRFDTRNAYIKTEFLEVVQ